MCQWRNGTICTVKPQDTENTETKGDGYETLRVRETVKKRILATQTDYSKANDQKKISVSTLIDQALDARESASATLRKLQGVGKAPSVDGTKAPLSDSSSASIMAESLDAKFKFVLSRTPTDSPIRSLAVQGQNLLVEAFRLANGGESPGNVPSAPILLTPPRKAKRSGGHIGDSEEHRRSGKHKG